jgi:hypothetical protein
MILSMLLPVSMRGPTAWYFGLEAGTRFSRIRALPMFERMSPAPRPSGGGGNGACSCPSRQLEVGFGTRGQASMARTSSTGRVLALVGLAFLVGAASSLTRSAAPRSALRMSTTGAKLTRGVHGQGSRFMPTVGLRGKEHAPRIMPIAGMLPHVTYEQLMMPENPEAPAAGRWKYYKMASNEAPYGFVCIDTPQILADAVNPVVVVAMAADLGIPMTDGKNDEILVLIDRADPAVTDPETYEPGKFYAYADADGRVDVAWQLAYPSGGQRVVGRVLYGMLPYIAPAKKEATGFAEMSDEYEF